MNTQRHPRYPASKCIRLAFAALIYAASNGNAQAGTFSVGPDGSFSTIQGAINAALVDGDTSNEVDIEAGTHDENLTLTQSSGTLNIFGGWNSTFTQRSLDPSATTIFGGGTARALDATVSGGDLTFSGVSFAGGTASDRGGGVFLHIANTGLVQIRNAHFIFNTVQASGTGNALGGAFYAELFNTSDLIFDGNVTDTNSASVVNGAANGGGIFIEVFDSADASLSNSVIQNNVALASGSSGHASAGGVQLDIADSAQVSFDRSKVLSNSLQASDANHAAFSGAFVSAGCSGNCQFGLDLSTFDGNHGLGQAQLAIAMGGTASPTARVADVLVSRGDGLGMQVQMDSGTANLVNLTVAANTSTGIYLVPNSTITLFNSLAFGNHPDLVEVNSGAQKGNNLSGVDPLFVDAAHGNYRLQSNSPARDAGTATPPGGLGLFDLDGNPRTFGPAPDIGAYEIGDRIFKNGFE
jgi:hypothetical protein